MSVKAQLTGTVVSDKMDKTVVVAVERQVRHGVYGKTQRKTSTFVAHNEDNAAKTGDTVSIAESRPLSKRKRWVVTRVVAKAQETGTPMRIGANSGSLPEHLKWTATADPIGALVQAAMEEVELLEELGFHDFKISVKSTSVPVMIGAYRKLSELVPYPLHLGVTEAGTLVTGAVKSSIGIGTLLE